MNDDAPDNDDKSLTRAFFEDQIPRAIFDNRTMFELLRGSICIAVKDEGAWTLRFGSTNPGFFTEELDESADCVLEFERVAFEKVLRSEPLEPQDEPRMWGEDKMLKAFGKLLDQGAKGQLGIRTSRE